MRTKEEIRREALSIRRHIGEGDLKSISRSICERIKALIYDISPEIVLTYISLPDEVSTHEIAEYLFQNEIRVAVPKVVGRDMVFHRISSFDELEIGRMNIMEPITDNPYCGTKGLAIIPGAAFDKRLGRVGYGGGYYDRYLAKRPDIIKAGLCPECLVLDKIPLEEYDVLMDYVITEDRILKGDSL